MKCFYFEKECPRKTPCTECMVDEINYLRKRVATKVKSKVKEGSIMITENELIHAQSVAFAEMVEANPMVMLIVDEIATHSAITIKQLFENEKEEK